MPTEMKLTASRRHLEAFQGFKVSRTIPYGVLS